MRWFHIVVSEGATNWIIQTKRYISDSRKNQEIYRMGGAQLCKLV